MPIVADEMSVPSTSAGGWQLESALPEAMAATWASEETAPLRHGAPPPGRDGTAFASYPEWVKFVRLVLSLNLVGIMNERPVVVNGTFAVPKQDDPLRRWIVDAQNANERFEKPDDPGLPSPTDVAALEPKQGTTMATGKLGTISVLPFARDRGSRCDGCLDGSRRRVTMPKK